MKKSKTQPLHFERAYLAHFPLDYNFFTDLDTQGGELQKKFKFQKE
jgi:hypothetical protein